MMERCYAENFKFRHNTTYENCKVCEEWHNYDNFKKWFYEHYYEIENDSVDLDKDILFKNNKTYSPETCVFVPHIINMLFSGRNRNKKSNLPTGVVKNNNMFKAQIRKYTKLVYIGTYFTIEEALKSYTIERNKYAKELADIYKSYISKDVYSRLYNL